MRPGGSVAERLDALPLTRLHVAVAILCGFGLVVDVAELSINGALAVILSAPPARMAPLQIGILVASVFIGAAIGAPMLGRLADRHGRRWALRLSLLLVALPSLAIAVVPDGPALIACRFVAGLALGAYPPLMTTYLSDVLPARRRATVVFIAVSIGILGWPAVLFAVRWLTPIAPFGMEGWRVVLIASGLLALAMAWAFRLLPESPRWLAAVGRGDAADAAAARFEASRGLEAPPAVAPPGGPTAAASVGTASAGPTGTSARPGDADEAFDATEHGRRVALLSAVYLLRAWPTIGFPTVSGALLVAGGWPAGESLLVVAVSGIGACAGAIVASAVVDRVERRTALTLCSLAMTALASVFAVATSLSTLLVAAFAFSVAGAIYGPLISVYANELFPTARRAAATATAWGANRLGSALAPLALLPLLAAGGPLPVLATIVGTIALNLVLVLAFGPRGRARRPVPQ